MRACTAVCLYGDTRTCLHPCIHACHFCPHLYLRVCVNITSLSASVFTSYQYLCSYPYQRLRLSLSVSGSFPGTYTPTGSCTHIHPHAYPCIYIYECSSFANFMLVEVTAKEDDTRSFLTTGPLSFLFFLLILIYIKIECSRDLGFLRPQTIIPALPR